MCSSSALLLPTFVSIAREVFLRGNWTCILLNTVHIYIYKYVYIYRHVYTHVSVCGCWATEDR